MWLLNYLLPSEACEKGHPQAGFAALHICKAAAARNAARGYVRVPETQASLGRLAPSLASRVQEMGHRNERLQVCVCLSWELPPPGLSNLCSFCWQTGTERGVKKQTPVGLFYIRTHWNYKKEKKKKKIHWKLRWQDIERYIHHRNTNWYGTSFTEGNVWWFGESAYV